LIASAQISANTSGALFSDADVPIAASYDDLIGAPQGWHWTKHG